MFASAVLLLSLVPIILMETQTTPERNIILHCLSLLRCNGRTPVCGSNGTHCWNADSDCERAKFNCLQLYKTDFDKVSPKYCTDLTVGAIKSCCIEKPCPKRNEPICGQAIHKTLCNCKWFRNHCEMKNVNCGGGKAFIEVNRALCDFTFDDEERICTTPLADTTTQDSLPE